MVGVQREEVVHHRKGCRKKRWCYLRGVEEGDGAIGRGALGQMPAK